MQGKIAVTLILFLFPALVVPLFLIAFLTRVPGGVGTFFTDYSAAFLWGIYLLLIAGGAAFLYYLKRRGRTSAQRERDWPNPERPSARRRRRAARQAAADSAAEPTTTDEEHAVMAESPQE